MAVIICKMRLSAMVAVIGILLCAEGVFAQQRPRPGRSGRIGPPPANAGMIERLNQMTPEQRKRALDKLPPERREKVEQRLENYNALPQDVKDKLSEQYQEFQKLPPDRQNAIRRSFRQLSELSDDRKPVVRRELNRLRRMKPEERGAAMESDRFRERFNESERQLLFDLSNSFPANEEP